MKKILYLITTSLVVFTLFSCKRNIDDNGDVLNDYQTPLAGINGPRALAKENINDLVMLHYLYNGAKLEATVASDGALTEIMNNGNLIYQIKYNGKLATDSAEVVQYYTYNTNEKLTEIAETQRIISLATPAVATKKYKHKYVLTYNTADKLSNIVKHSGLDVPGSAFNFTDYEKYNFTYTGENLTGLTIDRGQITSTGTLGPSQNQTIYSYQNYDTKFSPYTTLNWGYNLHYMLRDQVYGFHLSANNPGKVIVSGTTIPTPVNYTSTFSYDLQNYAITGFGYNFIYKPL